jgi:ribosome biogenesis GTPase
MKKYGFDESRSIEDFSGATLARVSAVHRERYGLICEFGECYGRLKTKEYYQDGESFPTAGDFVLIDYNPSGESRIRKTLPRKTFFSRRDPTPGRGEQIVAANFDYVFLMQSLNHDFNLKRLERYLTLAWQSGAVPVVVLTKLDLVEDAYEQIKAVGDVAFGVDIIALSAHTGEGMNAIERYVQPGKTLVFLGSSGVGKSSLVNALAGEEVMDVNGIREDDSKGRHTTTHRQMLMMKNGAMIIDTPGMRELGMWDVTEGLGEAFTDVEMFLGQCRFSDCSHRTEPGCAIHKAIENGELSQARWESYCRLEREARYSANKEGLRRRKEDKFKKIATANRLRKERKMK